MPQPLKIAVGIATAGRRDQMRLTLQQLAHQTQPPCRVLVCPAAPEDFDDSALPEVGAPIVRIDGPRGLCAQRNAILRHTTDCDVLLFIDDDYYMAADYLARLAGIFQAREDVVIVTSHPEHDGATGPGLDHDFAVQALARRHAPDLNTPPVLRDTYGGYGCNLSVRLAPVYAHDIGFDENLSLYGWLEDIDFSRRVAPFGRVVTTDALYGVHLGTKRGRTTGVRLGYSQVANPLYLVRKGAMSWRYATRQVLRNLTKNVVRAWKPEPWVDRRGRLRGNLRAVADVVAGRADPRRILEL